MKKAKTLHELINSIQNGKFTLDGSQLSPADLPNDIYLQNLGLTSLKGCPQIINYDFTCEGNDLENLEGGPIKLINPLNYYYCINNNLHSLRGAPPETYAFNCDHNWLTDLEYAPRRVETDFNCSNNLIQSLHNIHKIFDRIGGHFYAASNPGRSQISKAVLGLLLIPQLQSVEILPVGGYQSNMNVNAILNDCIKSPSPKKLIYKCAQELVKAGYPELAKL